MKLCKHHLPIKRYLQYLETQPWEAVSRVVEVDSTKKIINHSLNLVLVAIALPAFGFTTIQELSDPQKVMR